MTRTLRLAAAAAVTAVIIAVAGCQDGITVVYSCAHPAAPSGTVRAGSAHTAMVCRDGTWTAQQ